MFLFISNKIKCLDSTQIRNQSINLSSSSSVLETDKVVYFSTYSNPLYSTSDLSQIHHTSPPTYWYVVLQLLYGLVAVAPGPRRGSRAGDQGVDDLPFWKKGKRGVKSIFWPPNMNYDSYLMIRPIDDTEKP